MDYYNKDIKQVFKDLSSSIEGLSKEEVFKRRKENGLNEITEKNKITPFKRFIAHFNNVMIILLLVVEIHLVNK